MSLIFTESFDGVSNVAHLALGKWAIIGGGSSFVAGRNGNALQLDANNGTHQSYVDFATADRHATIIVGFAVKPTSVGNGYTFFQLTSDAGRDVSVSHMSIMGGGSNSLTVYGAGQVPNLGVYPNNCLTNNVWQYVEIKVVIADSGGTVELKVDQVSQGVKTGDTKYGAATVAHGIGLWSPSGTGQTVYDDLYVCNGAGTKNNDFIGDCKVECLRPNGNGTSSQLLGSDSDRVDNWMHVDEQAVNDADYVGSAVNDEQDTYVYSNLATPTGRVVGVQTVSRSLRMDTNAKSLAHVARVGASESAGSDNALTTTHANYRRLMETDPAAADWTIANVNAAEFGVRVRP